MKKGKSCMPLSCALKPLIFELSDSADALVDLLVKYSKISVSFCRMVSLTEMSSLIRLFPTSLHHSSSLGLASSGVILLLKRQRSLCTRL